jgi:hypothetical protein
MGKQKNKNSSRWSPRQQPVSNHFSLKSYVVFQSRKKYFFFIFKTGQANLWRLNSVETGGDAQL